MIRNSITLYEDDAMDVVSFLDDLLDYMNEHEDDSIRRIRERKERVSAMKKKIEDAVI